ncbi:hypothetical protein Bbelb_256270 [Branchiostoma belcheri]|nr:hypothetical protein Bbelb_256270 [Branchiostoma belcheri]
MDLRYSLSVTIDISVAGTHSNGATCGVTERTTALPAPAMRPGSVNVSLPQTLLSLITRPGCAQSAQMSEKSAASRKTGAFPSRVGRPGDPESSPGRHPDTSTSGSRMFPAVISARLNFLPYCK